MARRTLDVAGDAIGRALEAVVRTRHLSRLRHCGQLAEDAPLTELGLGSFDPRGGNAVDVLVDGADAFSAMAGAIASARRTIHITGWSASAGFALDRTAQADTTLAALLGAAGARGVRSRILLWAGAPVPLIRPTRRDAAQAARALGAAAGVRCVLDTREYPLDCHHEKILLVDDEVAFVGGLDLTDLVSDRWDTREHPARAGVGWHDAAVRVTGPVVADLANHFAQRWGEVAGETLPHVAAPAPTGEVAARVVRTIPERIYAFAPAGEFGVLAAHLDALRSAQRLVHLENQFLWAVEVVDVLVEKLRNPPRPDFRLVLVLPDKAHTGQDATLGQLSRLREADAGTGRLLPLTVQSDAAGHHVYVHAKIGIVDDRWLTVGSANLNSHSLFNDTEVNLVIEDVALAAATRKSLWREHTGLESEGDPIAFVDSVLRPAAAEEARRHAAGLPPTGCIRLIEGHSRRTDLLLGPAESMLVDL